MSTRDELEFRLSWHHFQKTNWHFFGIRLIFVRHVKAAVAMSGRTPALGIKEHHKETKQ